MSSVVQQPGLLSGLAYAKDNGTYTAPTDIIDIESFTLTDEPDIIEFETMRQSRNTTQNTRAGIHKVQGQLTAPFYPIQSGGLWVGAIGKDNPVAAAVALALAASPASYAAGTTSITLTAGAATTLASSLPSGVNNWNGILLQLGSTGTGNLEIVLIQSVSGATVNISATKYVHSNTDVCQVPGMHIGQEQSGTNKHVLQTYSFTANFANFFQWQLAKGVILKASLKGDNKTIKTDFSVGFQTLPNDVATSALTTGVSGETADTPWIMRDGGLLLPFSPSDTVPPIHSRIVSLDYTFDNGPITRQYGGGVQATEVYVAGARKQTLTWKEDLGTESSDLDVWANYVQSQIQVPAFLLFENPNTGATFSVHFPNCRVKKYNPVTAMNEPVSADGEIIILEDPTQGYAARICIVNGDNARTY